MANVAEKARFYLERSVPQLREFEEKEIFSKDEIRTLVQKRSEFEHIVLGPGSRPADFQAYIAWELSLEALRAKRCRRLKIKHVASSHAGQAKVFNVYERAVFRHPGSVELWRQYLDYAADVKATRRWRKIVTRALRLHPMDAGLWALAARRAARNGDMDNARSLFMRGCRFCNTEPTLWLEYARAEMEWLGRMEGKKGTKALAAARSAETVEEDDIIRLHDDDEDDDSEMGEGDGDLVILPGVSAAGRDDKKARKAAFNEEAVEKLEKSPALDGAIPKAIFEVSKKQPFFSAEAAEAFFNLFSLFTGVGAQPKLIQYVLDSMVELYPNHAATSSCLVRQPLVGVDANTAAFPKALRESLARLKAQTGATDDRELFATKTIGWIDPILAREDIDPAIRTVLEHTKRKLESP